MRKEVEEYFIKTELDFERGFQAGGYCGFVSGVIVALLFVIAYVFLF